MKKIALMTGLLFIVVGFSNLVWAENKVEELEQFEIRNYAPQKIGVNDLVFEARISNLTEILTKNLSMGKLVDVHYKIYWMAPAQYKIEVNGLPKGFEEVRADLITLIKGKLEFVLPEKFIEKFKGYTFKVEQDPAGKLIHAIDPTYSMDAAEVDILINKQGQLKSIVTKTPKSLVKTEFSFTPKSWSKNKFVLDKTVATSKFGMSTQMATNQLDYTSIDGVGFPLKLTIKNTMETIVPKTEKEKEKKVKQESGSIINFSNYEVNTGKAQRFMTEGLRR